MWVRPRRGAVAILCALLSSVTAAAQDFAPQPPALPVAPALPAAPPTLPVPMNPAFAEGTVPVADPIPGGMPPAAGAPTAAPNHLYDSMHCDDNYGLKALFDSQHPKGEKSKWYEKMNIRGYTQFRFGRTLGSNPNGVPVTMFGDRSINGGAEDFSTRRLRFIFFGDVSDYLSYYIQPDFSNTPTGSPNGTFFAQLRDAYGDVYFDKTRVHRLRVGLSKVPYGFENLQSSQNRVPLDRTDPINSGDSPNERDLGVFYYWTPEDKQKLFKDLVDGGLKGSGNYGIFGVGVYNGQGGSQLEQNRNMHTVARLTWPMMLASGQVVEASVQGYTGEYVVEGAPIRRMGAGASFTPAGTRATGNARGHRDQRIAASFIWYAQPWGFQAEWQYGEGPGLSDDQRAVVVRRLSGGYIMGMYKHETHSCGIFMPYARYQHYDGGYRAVANAPFGITNEVDLGVEWQIRTEMELVVEYNLLDNVSLTAIDRANTRSYRNFTGSALRVQFQINY